MEVCRCTRAKKENCKSCVYERWERDRKIRKQIIRIFKEARRKGACK
jgi:translation initiation factor 1 (eIF-1/SUI1)